MKKWIGAALLLLLVLLSACGGPKISEETAAADFGPTVRLYSRDLPVRSVRVDERQEGEDKNTLTLVLTVEAGDAEVDFRGGYTMVYAKQNKEWSCAGVYSDFDRDYRLVPLAALPEEEALKDLGEGTVITGSAQDLENLSCSFDYIQQQDFKYFSITQTGSRNYTYDERKFSWVQGVSEEPRVQAEWDILGEWISTGGSGTLTKNWSLPITVDITAVGADTVTLTANYNGRGGVIFQGEVPLDPLTGIDAWFENGWDSFGFVLTPDKGVVTGTGLRSNEGMEKRALVDIPEPVTPADTEFTYDLDPAAKTATLRSYKGAEPYLRIPDRFDGCAVTAIGDEAFARNKNLVQVVLPETVTSIGASAFANCQNLNLLELPAAVRSIGRQAFAYCSRLYSLELPQGLDTLEPYAFAYAPFEVLTLPEKITALPEGLFCCSGLRELHWEGALTAIGKKAFFGCKLAAIEIPGTVERVGESAFEECAYLTEVTFGEGVKVLEKKAFDSCSALTELTLPQSLTTLGQEAFSGCGKLAAIAMPDRMESIGWEAFYYCTSLTELRIPAGVTRLESYTVASCSALNQVWLPRSLTTVEEHAFSSSDDRLTTVYYQGSAQEWGQIALGQYGNDALREATVKYNAWEE